MFKFTPKYKIVSSLEIFEFNVWWVRIKEALENRTRQGLLPLPSQVGQNWTLKVIIPRDLKILACSFLFCMYPWSYQVVHAKVGQLSSFLGAKSQAQPPPQFRCFKRGTYIPSPKVPPRTLPALEEELQTKYHSGLYMLVCTVTCHDKYDYCLTNSPQT